MRQGFYRAGLEFPFPEGASSLDIVRTLRRWAKHQPTLDAFPWRLAGRLHVLLDTPQPDFAFAELSLLIKGEAARRIFAPAMSGYHRRMLAGMLKHHPQIAGILYEHLRYHVRGSLFRRGLEAWPDCEGISPLGYGNRRVAPDEVERNRRNLRAAILEAGRWYERTLALIGNSENLDGRASGHELHHWIGGADMPAAVRVPVVVEREGDALLIGPAMREAKPIIDAGWPLPEYPVDPDDVVVCSAAAVPQPVPALPPPAVLVAAQMLQSGLLLTAGPLLERMKPADRELANYLLSYKHPARKIPLSYAEIGRLLGCSDEAVRRRQRSLEKKHPSLRGLIAAARSRNRKGVALAPGPGRPAFETDDDSP